MNGCISDFLKRTSKCSYCKNVTEPTVISDYFNLQYYSFTPDNLNFLIANVAQNLHINIKLDNGLTTIKINDKIIPDSSGLYSYYLNNSYLRISSVCESFNCHFYSADSNLLNFKFNNNLYVNNSTDHHQSTLVYKNKTYVSFIPDGNVYIYDYNGKKLGKLNDIIMQDLNENNIDKVDRYIVLL